MSNLENAARQALEKMEYMVAHGEWYEPEQAITALRQALEQPVQEPVAWMYQCSVDSSGPVLVQHKRNWAESGSGLWTETPLYTEQCGRLQRERDELTRLMDIRERQHHEREDVISELRQALEQQQKCEPVAWFTDAVWGKGVSLEKPDFGKAEWKTPPKVTALYATPSDTEWVGLTEDEMTQVANTAETYTESVKLTEAALKEKNT